MILEAVEFNLFVEEQKLLSDICSILDFGFERFDLTTQFEFFQTFFGQIFWSTQVRMSEFT
jgi:hypothetical protein